MLHILLNGSPLALCLMAAAAFVGALSSLLLAVAFILLVFRAGPGDMPAIAHELGNCLSRQRGIEAAGRWRQGKIGGQARQADQEQT